MKPLLHMRNVCKAFPGVQALSAVDFAVGRGEIHALMGENGAGKSTLIKLLTGVHPRDSGEIEFADQAISPSSPREAEAVGISTVYQEINLIPNLSVAENIVLGRQPTRFGALCWPAIRERAKKALDRLGLDIDLRREVASYSMAIQQMVALARAIDIDCQLLILDEPTSSLDEHEVAQLFRVMESLRSEGMSMIFITHFIDQVYAVCDRITVLRNAGKGGITVGSFDAAVLPRLELIAAMLGKDVETVERADTELHAEAAPEGPAFLEAKKLGRRGSIAPFDLSLRQGEVVGLSGLLGSGRSEIARLFFGIDRPDSGTLAVGESGQSIKSPRQAIQAGIGFCSEDRKSEGIIPELSVRENLILAMQASRGPLRLLPRSEQVTVTENYITALNIKTPSTETPIANLSGGNQQKLLLARWLAMQPKLVILDEPTRGIDIGAKAEVEKLVQRLRRDGLAVLFISSELDEIVHNCDRVAVLRDRQKIGELEGGDIDANRIMHAIAQHDE
ncbi:MAG: monosaccharide-transporting ATPase [Rhodothermales bacterium]|jgi:monosaccharide-transporting ATPase